MILFIAQSFLFGNTATAEPKDLFPGLSSSIHDDASAIWSNPANFAFAPASSSAYGVRITDTTQHFGYAKQLGIIGTGISYQDTQTLGSWWSLRSALALKLDDHLTFSAINTWHSMEQMDDNMITWGAGLGWRPMRWLGFGAYADNLGTQIPEYNISERVTLSSGLSLFHNKVQIGLDYTSSFDSFTTEIGQIQYTIRARPINGLMLQAHGIGNDEFGVGINFGYGPSSVGGYGVFGTENTYSILGYSGVNDTSVVARGRRVAYFEFDDAYPYESQSGLFASSSETYFSLLNRFHLACLDPAIKGIYIHMTQASFSLAQIEELRQEIKEARLRGKQVIIYIEGSAGNAEYFLASAADKIYLHPSANLEFIGLSSERIYLRGMLDLVGVEPEFIKRSEYKSAPEQYTRHNSTPTSREQSSALLDDIYAHLLREIGSDRGFPEQTLKTLIDGGPYSAQQAIKKGFVDSLHYADEMEEILEEHFGTLHRSERSYGTNTPDGWSTNSEIAIVPIVGVIMPGESQAPGLLGGNTSAGAKTIVAQLNEAAEDSSIKAIVIRVDSPGGSAFASDQIWRAVEQAKAEKLVVVSMGSVAASGGYYVSAGANSIFAEETTITGSIGVYSGKFNVERLIDMVGVNVETEERGQNAGLYSMFQPWEQTQKEKMAEMIDITYDQFKGVVGQGRALPPEQVEAVARGRVWSGVAAKEQGLVDNNGGLFDAVEYAKEQVGISTNDVRLIQYVGGSSNSLYKADVLLQQHFQHPLKQDIAFLRALSEEQLWMIAPVTIRVH